MKRVRVAFIPALFVVLLLCLSSCTAPRYTTYRPAGDTGQQWKVKAEKTISGWVTVTFNGEQVLKGRYPIFGEREVRGSYQGHDVSMILKESLGERGITIWECLVC
jgi:hypothetical protein